MKTSKLFLFLAACSYFGSFDSFALVKPYSLDHNDPSVQRYNYSARSSYDLPVGVEATVLVQIDDEIAGTSMDNEDDYSFVPLPNRRGFFLIAHKPVKNTVTVVTEGRVYVFRTRIVVKDMPKSLSFNYGRPGVNSGLIVQTPKPAPPIAKPTVGFGSAGIEHKAGDVINRKYSFKGDAGLLPGVILDNGRFTVMRFDRIAPLVYAVLPNGREELVNSHLEDGFLVVHQTSKQFTLRMGERSVCLFNLGGQYE